MLTFKKRRGIEPGEEVSWKNKPNDLRDLSVSGRFLPKVILNTRSYRIVSYTTEANEMR